MSGPKSDPEADVWEDLAQGELSREEEAVLRALAEEGEEAAVHYEAFAPLDEGFRARTTEKLAAQVETAKHARQRRRFAALASVLAAAAAILLFVVPKGSTLAPYSLEVSGGTAEMRGAPAGAGPVNYDDTSKLTLVAKPNSPVQGKVVASLALLDGQSAQTVVSKQTVASTGAVRIEIKGADLKPQSRSVRLAVIVERAALEPTDLLRLDRDRDPRVLIVELRRNQ